MALSYIFIQHKRNAAMMGTDSMESSMVSDSSSMPTLRCTLGNSSMGKESDKALLSSTIKKTRYTLVLSPLIR